MRMQSDPYARSVEEVRASPIPSNSRMRLPRCARFDAARVARMHSVAQLLLNASILRFASLAAENPLSISNAFLRAVRACSFLCCSL